MAAIKIDFFIIFSRQVGASCAAWFSGLHLFRPSRIEDISGCSWRDTRGILRRGKIRARSSKSFARKKKTVTNSFTMILSAYMYLSTRAPCCSKMTKVRIIYYLKNFRFLVKSINGDESRSYKILNL